MSDDAQEHITAFPPPPRLPRDTQPSDIAQLVARLDAFEDRLDSAMRQLEHQGASVGTAIDLLNRLSDDLARVYAVVLTVADDQASIHERLRKLPCNRPSTSCQPCDPSGAGYG